MPKGSGNDERGGAAQKENFFFKIFSFLGIGDDPDRAKRQLLKDIKRTIKKNFSKFANPSKDLAEPGLAKFFWEIYSVIGAAQALLSNAKSSGALKNIVIESFLSEKQRKMHDALFEDRIRARGAEVPTKMLVEEIKNTLLEFTSSIDLDTQKRMDSQYNLLMSFLDFIEFNFHFLLKKFDSSLPERDFNYMPHFESLNGDYVLEDLKDFLVVYQPITPGSDWDAVFDILKAYKNVEVIARPSWKKVLMNLQSFRKSNALINLIWYLGKDPYFKPGALPQGERIVEPYLNMLRTQTEVTLQKIVQERKTEKIGQLVKQIFGSEGVARTKYYTEKANLNFQKKLLGGYLYVEPINYLKAFLLDYYKRDIRDLVNMLLVKAQWAVPGASGPFSESFHYMMDFAEKVSEFDENLAEDTDKGAKLKTLLLRVDRDSNAMASIKQILKAVNDQAKAMILDSGTHLVVLAKHLKACVDDFQKPKHEMILNWNQLALQAPKKMGIWLQDTYKSLYYFIQLLQFFVKE